MSPTLMVAIESVSLVFMLIVLAAYIVLPRTKSIRKDFFLYSLAITILATSSDTVAWACETFRASRPLQYSSNFLSVILTSFLVNAFAYYTLEMINEKHLISKLFGWIVTAFNFTCAGVAVVAAFCGELFDVVASPDDPAIMIYDGGLFYDVPAIGTSLTMLFLFVLVLHYARNLGRMKIAVFSFYFMLPLIAGLLEIFSDELQFSYVATCISMSIIYVMLQSNRMNEMILREKVLNEVSYTDHLTGLLNRRAFERDIESLKSEDSVTVVFCDLNGLKKINDEEGHSAGDQYIIKFSLMLLDCFDREFVYRISGDEFVVFTRNMDEKECAKCIENLADRISKNKGIASFGYAKGGKEGFRDLVKSAELKMYDAKNEFYRLNPEYMGRKSAILNSESEQAAAKE